MMNTLIRIVALFLTIVLEVIAILVYKKMSKKNVDKYLFASFIVNVITNVPLNILLTNISQNNLFIYFVILVLLEIIIIIIEGLIYFVINKNIKEAFIISLLCNSFSFIIGTIILNFLIIPLF